jgi:hypothetical protein
LGILEAKDSQEAKEILAILEVKEHKDTQVLQGIPAYKDRSDIQVLPLLCKAQLATPGLKELPDLPDHRV